MSAVQRRKMKKRRKTQCEVLEAMCELVGIKVIYTKRNHVRLFWASLDELSKWETLYGDRDFGPEVSIGKQANKRFDDLVKLLRK